jgi:hypothetical protein
MTSLAAKRLVTVAFATALQIPHLQLALAYPIDHPETQSSDLARVWAGNAAGSAVKGGITDNLLPSDRFGDNPGNLLGPLLDFGWAARWSQ